jgi:hypothetical protein
MPVTEGGYASASGVWSGTSRVQYPCPPAGASRDLPTAKSDFKAAWESFKLKHTEEQFEAAYRATSATMVARSQPMTKLPSYTGVDSENPGGPRSSITAIARSAGRSSTCEIYPRSSRTCTAGYHSF